MKIAALFLSGLVAAFAVGSATAETVRVRVTARVSNVSDPNSALENKVVVGQRVSGIYVYNSDTPNTSTEPQLGHYVPYANEARARFVVGLHVFESQPATQGIQIDLSPGANWIFHSSDNKDLANGTPVNIVEVVFDGQGNLNQTTALVAALPDLNSYPWRRVNLGGPMYSVEADIETVELVASSTVEISPASGRFVATQAFDAAVILPRNSVVQNAHAMANGNLLPLTYPGVCQFQPQVGVGRPSLLCPGANSAVGQAAGAPIEWTIELTNGTILTGTVNWTIAP